MYSAAVARAISHIHQVLRRQRQTGVRAKWGDAERCIFLFRSFAPRGATPATPLSAPRHTGKLAVGILVNEGSGFRSSAAHGGAFAAEPYWALPAA
jgi:hypothetical protein